ncbi:MAG: hypothetical protein J5966_00580 [Lachnospiraceae bacterium]|nr:hypothetical protein [Lachnospiraceae bacterium]
MYRHLYRIATTFDTELPDSVKKGIEEYPYDKQLIDGPVEDEAEYGKVKISWNEYCSRLLVMSSYIARHRLGRKDDDTPVTQDAEVKKEMDKVFQEFMVLFGIDPATMMLKSNEQFFRTITSG